MLPLEYQFPRTLHGMMKCLFKMLHEQYRMKITHTVLTLTWHTTVALTMVGFNDFPSSQWCTSISIQPFYLTLLARYSINDMSYPSFSYKIGFALEDFAHYRLMVVF